MIIKPYVYKCTHKETGEFYIGSRWANKINASFDLGFKYFTSTKKIDRNNIHEFDLDIIKEFDYGEDAWNFEQLLIRDNFTDTKIMNGQYKICETIYFRNIGGYKLSDETKSKMRKPKSLEATHNIGEANRIRLSKECEREKMRKPKSDKARANMKGCQLGKIVKLETKIKISEFNKNNGIKPPNQKGKIYITNGIKNTPISKDVTIPDGWYIGRTKFKTIIN